MVSLVAVAVLNGMAPTSVIVVGLTVTVSAFGCICDKNEQSVNVTVNCKSRIISSFRDMAKNLF